MDEISHLIFEIGSRVSKHSFRQLSTVFHVWLTIALFFVSFLLVNAGTLEVRQPVACMNNEYGTPTSQPASSCCHAYKQRCGL
jgi:hypothetical protein